MTIRFEIVDKDFRTSRASTLYVGMDEAGRGPVMGPMIIGIAIATKVQISSIKKLGVMDSKVLKAVTRDKLFGLIKEKLTGFGILSISAKEIDDLRTSGITLNEIEVMAFKQLLNEFEFKQEIVLQLDAADVIAERFGKNFESMVNGEIISKHKGDSIFPAVSAASILAKVTRDAKMEKIQQEVLLFDNNLPRVGSGYPNKISKLFLSTYYRRYKKYPAFTRTTWDTAKSIKNEIDERQTSLNDFF